MKNILLSAHKGGFEDMYVANSLAAVEAVRDIGVDLIEFDVRVTSDGAFVTLHDENIVVNGVRKPISELPVEQVLEHAEGACLLEDMLQAIGGHAIGHVDLKDTHGEVEIADMCQSIVGKDNFILTTLEDESVLKLRQARPELQVALSLGRSISGLSLRAGLKVRLSEIFPGRRIEACQPTMLALNHKLAKYGVLRWAQRHQLPVLLWTINDPKRMKKVWANNRIWAFTTNYPRQALAIRDDLEN